MLPKRVAGSTRFLIRCTNWQHPEGPLLDQGGGEAGGRGGAGLAIARSCLAQHYCVQEVFSEVRRAAMPAEELSRRPELARW